MQWNFTINYYERSFYFLIHIDINLWYFLQIYENIKHKISKINIWYMSPNPAKSFPFINPWKNFTMLYVFWLFAFCFTVACFYALYTNPKTIFTHIKANWSLIYTIYDQCSKPSWEQDTGGAISWRKYHNFKFYVLRILNKLSRPMKAILYLQLHR